MRSSSTGDHSNMLRNTRYDSDEEDEYWEIKTVSHKGSTIKAEDEESYGFWVCSAQQGAYNGCATTASAIAQRLSQPMWGKAVPSTRGVLQQERCYYLRAAPNNPVAHLACLRRNAQCAREGVDAGEPRTLPQALREIDRLKLCLKELETELLRYKSQSQYQYQSKTTPDQSSDSSSQERGSQFSPNDFSPPAPAPTILSLTPTPRPQWEGIHIATARSDQVSYYGPTSSFYFMSRIGDFLGKALQQPFADRSLQPRGANRRMHLGTAMDDGDEREDAVHLTASADGQTGPLTRAQEESFLGLFWEGYHCLQPIVDEVEFRRHFASLWEPSRQRRKQSPLVDIVIALCMQHGNAIIPRESASSNHDPSLEDATVSGRWYYRRAQALLTADLESPSIMTVQCYLFTSIYLCCASFHNMSHIVTAQALRSAQVLGLHLEPPMGLPHGERELRKRIWWALWGMDAKTSAKFGRPFLVDRAQVTVTLPSDGPEAAFYNSAILGSYGPNVTWLTYSIQSQKLYLAMVHVHNLLFVKCGEVMSRDDLTCLYHDPEALESCAKVLASQLPVMQQWLKMVPLELRTRRQDGGVPFSTDHSTIELEALAPKWLRRQRICLELMYHSMMINLTRPFISFYSYAGAFTPVAERLATTCVDHAVAYTLIANQVVTVSDLIGGSTEFFSLQWNASITIVGFILAYPRHPSSSNARGALDNAVNTFATWGETFPVSADAAAITRCLMAKADLLGQRLNNGNLTASAPGTDDTATVAAGTNVNEAASSGVEDGLAWLDPSRQEDDQFSHFMDWALSMDSFNSYETFFDAGNSADPWAFGAERL
ncbi:hypothetical protein V493_07205 [Pseudogymnoascus sp. VKM F-4281 (FW-2241)]|nr:hypothetical protein V493_07205 [Pseudogymnoascus sp. VKM F-4281 (FW-2241)]